MSLAQAVKAEAHRLGFQLVGITSPDPPPHHSKFEQWLAAGRAGEMAYLAAERSRQRRADPRRILPECRSIVVLGIRYPAPRERVPRFITGERERSESYPESNTYHYEPNACHPERSEGSQSVLDGDPSSQSTLLRMTRESVCHPERSEGSQPSDAEMLRTKNSPSMTGGSVCHLEEGTCHPERSEGSQAVLNEDPSSQSTFPRMTGESVTHTGRVAAYAWGNDYHDILPGRLRALVAFIESQAGRPVPNRWYTDTGPILERDLAQRAGLGWIGKNTCLIHPRLGSYFLLAEILLGIELEPDPPFAADRCGTCTRCLEACPTNCILPDRTLDASRCLSYLTIEVKGAVPEDLRLQMGAWVFGCDVCQQVCPWNHRAAGTPGDPDFAPRPQVLSPDLIQELSLTPEEFNRKFKGSPVKRAKRRGYLRNVAVALGNLNSGGKEYPPAVAALARALQEDPEPLVRGHAAWAMGQVGGEAARSALEKAASHEADASVQSEIRSARNLLSHALSQE